MRRLANALSAGRMGDWLLYRTAGAYRRCFPFTTFIGVTGSGGKTTTKELIGAVLSSRWKGEISQRFSNGPSYVAKSLLRVPPWRRFCLNELGGPGPGRLALTLRFYRPHVGVVTWVQRDHWSRYRNLDSVAAEKGRLVKAVPPAGAAILNADDPRVLAMQHSCRGRVITYGMSALATVRGSEVHARWPDRLSLSVEAGGERIRVVTRLVGEHWASSVLAAIATGLAFGIRLSEAAPALAGVAPVDARMSVHPIAGAIHFIRDDWKASPWTVEAALRFLDEARCRRKVAVIGTLSDYSGSRSAHYRKVARSALAVAARVVFVGENAHHVRKVRPETDPARLKIFERLADLHEQLDSLLEPGDLVLLKGSNHADHLERLVLARTMATKCWRVKCGRWLPCSQCELRDSRVAT